jgi:hypothetical protein
MAFSTMVMAHSRGVPLALLYTYSQNIQLFMPDPTTRASKQKIGGLKRRNILIAFKALALRGNPSPNNNGNNNGNNNRSGSPSDGLPIHGNSMS